MDTEKLLKIGLTEGEARVYLALAETGSATVGPVVRKSGVAYSNIYEILERLIKKGLVSFIIKSKTRYFQALEPGRLYDYIEMKEAEVRSQRKVAEQLVPELSRFSKRRGEKLEAEVFIGLSGMKTAYEKVAAGCENGCEYVYIYGPEKGFMERVDTFFLDLDKKVYTKSGMKMKGILSREYFSNSRYIRKSKKISRGEEEVRYVDFPVPGNIDVHGDKVLIASWAGPVIAVLIHSNDMADSFRKYFDSVWKKARK